MQPDERVIIQRLIVQEESGKEAGAGTASAGAAGAGAEAEAGATSESTRAHPAARAFSSVRGSIGRHPTANRVYRTTVGVAGTGTVLLGVALIPLPGPGSLIALGGLALLGTEFTGPKKVSTTMNKAAKAALKRTKDRRAAKAATAAKADMAARVADAEAAATASTAAHSAGAAQSSD